MRKLVLVVVAVLAAGTMLALGGCGPAAGDVTGAEWQLVTSSLDTTGAADAGITAKFEAGRMFGFSGVNQYTGPYVSDKGGAFEAGPFTSTLMAGSTEKLKAEKAYLRLVERCDTYLLEREKLTLSVEGQPTLIYVAVGTPKLAGTSWTVTGYNNGKQAVQSVSADTSLTVVFGEDGKVSGNAGVNTYNGPFTAEVHTVKIGPLVATRMAGPEDLMTQETLFLEALQNSVKWEIRRGMLVLSDDKGATQVNGVHAP